MWNAPTLDACVTGLYGGLAGAEGLPKVDDVTDSTSGCGVLGAVIDACEVV
jgi:hypothetical protein